MTYKAGMDISYWQGDIDWSAVRNSRAVDFVIIRAGSDMKLDQRFKDNVRGCVSQGIPYGLYWASYATSEEEAVSEARLLYRYAKMCMPTYPLYYDYEEFSLSNLKKRYPGKSKAQYRQRIRDIITAWGTTIEILGGYAAIYGNKSFTSNYIGEDMLKRFDYWYANWTNAALNNEYRMVQFTNKGKIPGVNTNVDLDICRYDYPKLIQGRFNGS